MVEAVLKEIALEIPEEMSIVAKYFLKTFQPNSESIFRGIGQIYLWKQYLKEL